MTTAPPRTVHNAIVEAAGASMLPAAGSPPAIAGNLTPAVAGAMAREQATILAAYAAARQNPRNEDRCVAQIQQAYSRLACAQDATYSFPRGKERVEGPSVYLARECARIWGNIHYGLRIIDETEARVHLQGYAFDAESGARCEVEDKFPKRIQRRVGGAEKATWIDTDDERDIREMVNRRGALALRNALLQVIPSWFVDEALARAKVTQRNTTAAKIVESFAPLGVTQAAIERRYGKGIDDITAEEKAELLGIFNSIRDGNSKVSEEFPPPKTEAATETIDKETGEVTPAPAPEPPRPRAASAPPPAQRVEPGPKHDDVAAAFKVQKDLFETAIRGDAGLNDHARVECIGQAIDNLKNLLPKVTRNKKLEGEINGLIVLASEHRRGIERQLAKAKELAAQQQPSEPEPEAEPMALAPPKADDEAERDRLMSALIDWQTEANSIVARLGAASCKANGVQYASHLPITALRKLLVDIETEAAKIVKG